MLLLRKIDCYGQLILVSCMILSIPFFLLFGVGLGMLLLGGWQILSAMLNTYLFINTGYKKQIMRYWILCLTDLALLSLFVFFENKLVQGHIMIILWISLGGAAFIAGYYLTIYYRLIGLISLRNELDGLTKSKH